MKKIAVLFLLISFSMTASADVSHSIQTGVDQVKINSTIKLSCDLSGPNCPVNKWQLKWQLPEGAKTIAVKDSIGEIEDYKVSDNTLSITTNSGDRRSSETVKIQMRIDRDAKEVYRGLYKREFSLAGFKGEKNTGTLKSPDLLSGWTSHGFDTAYGSESLNFSGEGSLALRIKFGEGEETPYYEFFGSNPAENTSLAYEVSVGMTGLVQQFERFPVASMDSEYFESSVAEWSAGEYVGGSIKIREDLEESEYVPVLAHEVVHGLNDRQLNWDQTKSSYMEEGTGKYVEFLLERKMKGMGRVGELFGDEVTYREEREDGNYKITIPSSGDRDRLWEYYQNDRDFMKTWTPMSSEDTRDFGYAYSELIVRNYVANDQGSLKDVYREVEVDKPIESVETKWNLYRQFMDMTPCKYPDRERFNQCLENVNDYNYQVYRAENIDRSSRSITINQIELPNRTSQRGSIGLEIFSGNSSSMSNDSAEVQKTLKYGFEMFRDFAEFLTRLFESMSTNM